MCPPAFPRPATCLNTPFSVFGRGDRHGQFYRQEKTLPARLRALFCLCPVLETMPCRFTPCLCPLHDRPVDGAGRCHISARRRPRMTDRHHKHRKTIHHEPWQGQPRNADYMLAGKYNRKRDTRKRIEKQWCRLRDSNPRPPDYKSGALPSELSRHALAMACAMPRDVDKEKSRRIKRQDQLLLGGRGFWEVY